ncbi:hypothetical protein [Pseudoduganella violaceinigra]|uniref:hypothetical protein n=1 Tax=Pseudoduganella violaceinigra TaxID=246602 RepID=UPI0004821711|nr:hypothetical protein [Pseudoduganella violaceinigra]
MIDSRYFPVLYKECRKAKLLEKGADAIQALIDRKGVQAVVESKQMFSFLDVDGYLIKCAEGVAFFPRTITPINRNSGVTRLRKIFLDVDLVLPPYIPLGYLSSHGAQIENAKTPQEKERLVGEMLEERCNGSLDMADACTGIYQRDPCIVPFYDSLLEAIEAHYLGLHRASVLTLIPCVEGIIRNLAKMVGMNIDDRIDAESFLETLTKVQRRHIKEVELKGIDWIPTELASVAFFDQAHERIQMVESIRVFVEHALYQHTSMYGKTSRLNRHGIVHGLISDFHTPTNFYRLIVLINALSVASIVAGRSASLLRQPSTKEGLQLAMHFEACKATAFQAASSKHFASNA